MDKHTYSIQFDVDPKDLECLNSKLIINKDGESYKILEGFKADVCFSMIRDAIEADYNDCKLEGNSGVSRSNKDMELEDMECELKELIDDIKQKKYSLIFDATGLQSNEVKISSFWDCLKSPVGKCVYDIIEDPYRDSCVFCHEPEDRR